MDTDGSGWQFVSSDTRFSPISDADPPLDTDCVSDDDLPLSQLPVQRFPQCDMCRLTFKDLKPLKKHLKKYKYHHGYYECCGVIEEGDHVCKTGGKKKKKRKKLTGDAEKKNFNFKCFECPSSFPREVGLQTHLRFVHKTKFWKCEVCEETLRNEEEFVEHVNMHGPEDKIVCKNCWSEFSTLKQYRTHAKMYSSPHNFPCKLCLRKFYTEAKRDEHVCIFTNGEPLVCACGKVFSSYSDVVEHTKGPKPFHCCSCDHFTTSLTCYIRHVRKHSSQNRYSCKLCSIRVSSFEFLKNHMKNVHGSEESAPRSLDCSACGITFASEAGLNLHAETHEERVQCPQCGKSFRKSRLEMHIAKHKLSSCLCPDCGKLFDSHCRLTHHILSAHNSQPVTCDVCSKVLKTKKILQEHLKTHLKTEVGRRVAQAVCPQCGLELAQKGSLSRHILLVHERHRLVKDDRPRLCKECGVLLPNKNSYYTHRRQHRAMVERYPCPVCLREFNKKPNLSRHMYLLHDSNRKVGDRNYSCEMCSRAFRERKNLVRHYRLVHQINDFT